MTCTTVRNALFGSLQVGWIIALQNIIYPWKPERTYGVCSTSNLEDEKQRTGAICRRDICGAQLNQEETGQPMLGVISIELVSVVRLLSLLSCARDARNINR
jgi:hypothetical protein